MKKQTTFFLAAIIFMVVSFITTASATVRTFQFTGTIGSSTYVATLSYDDSQSPTNTTTGSSDYASYSFILVVDGTTTYYGAPTSLLTVFNDQFFGDYIVTNGTGVGYAGFSLGDASGTVFNSTSLPTSLPLGSFNSDVWVAIVGSSSILGDIETITDLTPTGSYDIYTVNAKTGNTERVTFLDDADEYNPSFNNNGKLVAHDVVSSSDPNGQSIYITDLKTKTSTPLAGAEGGNDASWSPNGEFIAFDRNGNIYVVPSAGGTATLVRENAIDAEWSNNSKRLVFTDITDGFLRTVDLNGGSETNLGVQGVNASWSPDGKQIAYSDGDNLFTIAVSEAGNPSGTPVQLTFDSPNTNNQQPSWSNNGKTIVFQKASGSMDIWTVSSSGGTQQLLTGLANYGDYDPCYSKNGQYVAYAGFTTLFLPKRNSNNGEQVSSNKNSLPSQYVLDQNFPNPFNPSTQIRFGIPQAGNVALKIYNSVGQLVKTLLDGNMSEGFHQVTWDATDNRGSKLSSGIYFYRLTAGKFTQINKMLLLK